MSQLGKGKIYVVTSYSRQGDALTADVYARLYNFDIDKAEIKPEHLAFLKEQVSMDLSLNRDSRVYVLGSASKTGESEHNRGLSGRRATGVHALLRSKDVLDTQFVPGSPFAGGEEVARSARDEDEWDRAVVLYLSFPITIDKVSLHTDGWRSMVWDDVIGMDVADGGEAINKINIQVVAKGASRFWEVDGRHVSIMPRTIDVQVSSRGQLHARSPGTITSPLTWAVPLTQPEPPTYRSLNVWTNYRLSRPISDAGGFLNIITGKPGEVATVGRQGATSDIIFRTAATGLVLRGVANQPASVRQNSWEPQETPDALRLLYSGGLEVLVVEALGKGDVRKRVAKNLVRNPADVFYYTGTGRADGWLSIDKDQWASPKDLQRYWKSPMDLDLLILAASAVLDMNVSDGKASGGPGVEWARLLRNYGGPLIAILGYGGGAPADDPVGNAIARKMAGKIAAGLKSEDWAETWLDINADNKAGNAVAMDTKGYWWLQERGFWRRGFGKPNRVDEGYNIMGPEKMAI